MRPTISLPAILALFTTSRFIPSANAAAVTADSSGRVWKGTDSYLSYDEETRPSSSLLEPPRDVDVVVVGGGFSGLMSAYELQKAGLRTVVLEAKDTIGGRSRSMKRQSGAGIIELGATWINNKTQPVIYGLTQEFGLDLAEQYTDGESVFQGPDGRILKLPPDSLVNVGLADLLSSETTTILTDFRLMTPRVQ